MGKFHVIAYLQKYDNKGPIFNSINPFYTVCLLAFSLILNYYYWGHVYPLNLGEHMPLAQVSGIPPSPSSKGGRQALRIGVQTEG